MPNKETSLLNAVGNEAMLIPSTITIEALN